MKRVIEGEVIGVTRNTEGYGETLRPVGVNVEVEYKFDDPDEESDKVLARKSTIVLPYELRHAVVLGAFFTMTFDLEDA